MATFCPGRTVAEKSWMTSSPSSYPNRTWSNSTFPATAGTPAALADSSSISSSSSSSKTLCPAAAALWKLVAASAICPRGLVKMRM